MLPFMPLAHCPPIEGKLTFNDPSLRLLRVRAEPTLVPASTIAAHFTGSTLTTCRLSARERLCSGCVMVCKDAVRRIGIERCQSRIEAEPRRAIGTEDSVRLAHIDVDVRVVLRWGHADALELLHPDADFRDAVVVSEFRIADAGHRFEPL